MKGFLYRELAKKINDYFFDQKNAYVSVTALKFWVEEGILPAPQGSARWRYFNWDDFFEAINIRRLQVYCNQSIEDIKKIISLAKTQAAKYKFPQHSHYLSKLYSSLGNRLIPEDAIQLIEAFKNNELHLVYDKAYKPPYRLLHKDGLFDSYYKEGDKVYRSLLSITDKNNKVIYFKPEQIEQYLKFEKEEIDKILKIPSKPTDSSRFSNTAENMRMLLNEGIMTQPRYRYKGENYFSEKNLSSANCWLLFMNDGLSLDDLKRLRSRIESDIENYFYVPEISPIIEELISYEFEKQVILFDDYLGRSRDCFILGLPEEEVESHTEEDNLKIARDYLNGFLFLCKGLRNEIGLKKTPLERLSAEQIKAGLSQGKFTQKEVERVLRNKEAEVKALKTIAKQHAKGGRHDNHDKK